MQSVYDADMRGLISLRASVAWTNSEERTVDNHASDGLTRRSGVLRDGTEPAIEEQESRFFPDYAVRRGRILGIKCGSMNHWSTRLPFGRHVRVTFRMDPGTSNRIVPIHPDGRGVGGKLCR